MKNIVFTCMPTCSSLANRPAYAPASKLFSGVLQLSALAACMLLMPAGLFAQATLPTIVYQSPKPYTVGTTVVPLAPVSTGVAARAFNETHSTMAGGFAGLADLTADAAGNVYLADSAGNAVQKIVAGTTTPVSIGSGFKGPTGVAADLAGNVFVADNGNGAVKMIPAGGGPPVTIGSGFTHPSRLAVDLKGGIYVIDGTVVKMVPSGGGPPVIIGSGFIWPSAVAVDFAGNVYVADRRTTQLTKLPAGGGTPVAVGSGLFYPNSVVIDAADNLYVVDGDGRFIKQIQQPSNITTLAFLAPGDADVVGAGIDGGGNLYLADLANKVVDKVKPAGGYLLTSTYRQVCYSTKIRASSVVPQLRRVR